MAKHRLMCPLPDTSCTSIPKHLETREVIESPHLMLPYRDVRNLPNRDTLTSSALGPSVPPPPSGEAIEHHRDGNSIWIDELLLLCDEVRQSLWKSHTLGPRREAIMGVLGEAVQGECNMRPRIRLRTIQITRLDKLLEDMVNPANHPATKPAQFRADVTIAESLQRQWRIRFGAPYRSLDAHRCKQLRRPSQSCMAVCFTHSIPEKAHDSHVVSKWQGLSENEGNEQFQVGYWWPHLACAHRDGLLCSPRDVLSAGQYGIPTLPLLWGSKTTLEASSPSIERVKFGRYRTPKDMCVPLISQVGGKIRILRGHGLESSFAPAAGIRYDGQYKILQYGQRREEEIYCLELTLKRCEGQVDVANLMCIPRPSQLDD
ncbi:uncharacterized protein F5Z01DRAFT_164014 [Emericellopsis atlantica]|uniref:YDG domain-containing protein n=1 Tax=Emericellopsis atlantica TaxID=2614577 RepID=A0A9P7ZKH5_9HYPO|nr:uncharacterized protein F5Z01DRAFT_164014 [Emericellopsis atlantica]KAG9253352.1 hypothetical protein F5Z01DRAFT_164014 [Emericellopsis atlantica]